MNIAVAIRENGALRARRKFPEIERALATIPLQTIFSASLSDGSTIYSIKIIDEQKFVLSSVPTMEDLTIDKLPSFVVESALSFLPQIPNKVNENIIPESMQVVRQLDILESGMIFLTMAEVSKIVMEARQNQETSG